MVPNEGPNNLNYTLNSLIDDLEKVHNQCTKIILEINS